VSIVAVAGNVQLCGTHQPEVDVELKNRDCSIGYSPCLPNKWLRAALACIARNTIINALIS